MIRPGRMFAGALTVILLLPLLSAPARAQDLPDLKLLHGKLHLRSGEGLRDSLKLRILLRSELLPAGFDATQEPLEVRVGPETILSLPGGGDGEVLLAKDAWRSVYREKRSKERTGVRKLKLDLASGRLTLRAKRLDLSALRDAGPEGVVVTVVLGEWEFTAPVDFSGGSKTWKYRAPKAPIALHHPTGDGGGPGPDGSGAELSVRILPIPSWISTVGATTRVARDQASYASLWSTFVFYPPGSGVPDPAPPFVDFGKEIVVAVAIGERPSGGYTVTVSKAERQGIGVLVSWEELAPGANCAASGALTYPFVFAAITRVEGTVSFAGQQKTVDCPVPR
jgi:hypothetical protein